MQITNLAQTLIKIGRTVVDFFSPCTLDIRWIDGEPKKIPKSKARNLRAARKLTAKEVVIEEALKRAEYESIVKTLAFHRLKLERNEILRIARFTLPHAKVDISDKIEWILRKFYKLGCKAFSKEDPKINAISTFNTYVYDLRGYLRWREAKGMTLGTVDRAEDFHNYLKEIALYYAQPTIDKQRSVFSLLFNKKTKFVKSHLPKNQDSRAYSNEDFQKILPYFNKLEQLALLLIWYGGFRCHEIARLYPFGWGEFTKTRDFSNVRFLGLRDFVVLVAPGKGGLKRGAPVPIALYLEIERMGLIDFNAEKVDVNGAHLPNFFKLPYGKKLSQEFTRISKEILGFSRGIHGLRHSYAMRRFETLKAMKVPMTIIMTCISQELGHFRPNITANYLREKRFQKALERFFSLKLKTKMAEKLCLEFCEKKNLSQIEVGTIVEGQRIWSD